MKYSEIKKNSSKQNKDSKFQSSEYRLEAQKIIVSQKK